MSGFQVDHQQLATAGREISQHGSGSSSIAQQVSAAEVPTTAWGLLGIECGLYEMYLGMLSDLNQHLTDLGQHLDSTGSAMVSTAQAYQQVDQQIQQTMQKLSPGEAQA